MNQNKPKMQIAITGMSCLFPKAPDLSSFWTNIVSGTDCTRDATASEWDPDRFFDPSSKSFDRIYCKRGGFITELAEFDPLQYGVMPKTIEGADPDQLLALRVAAEALKDAGYTKNSETFDRAEIILGRTSAPGAGAMNLIQHGQTIDQILDIIRTVRPDLSPLELTELAEQLHLSLRPCNSDTLPATMPNVIAGRIAGRLGFKGRSLILDAACASSLIAVEIAAHDLQTGMCDLALAGGIHINSLAYFYQMFCGLGALSRNQQIRPFDEMADGTLLGEGIGMVVLKRYEDAIKDGDRIYSVIVGLGSASDGHGTSMLAPSIEGEALALHRAYEMANVSPSTIGLLEAHGTGTPTGDVSEMQAIDQVYGQSTSTDGIYNGAWCAVGSVKSMIGHCQAASGVAGLIKTALSLYHRILPPTINVTKPNPQIDWKTSACYINTKARTWIQPGIHPEVAPELVKKIGRVKTAPRRAAVSAFGFGGANSHVVLEEHPDPNETNNLALLEHESDICVLEAKNQQELINKITELQQFLQVAEDIRLKDVAFTLTRNLTESQHGIRTAIVASSINDLIEKLEYVRTQISQEPTSSKKNLQSKGIYLGTQQEAVPGKVAFVLPGLGAAYPNMLSELCLHFPEVRSIFDFVDQISKLSGSKTLPSKKIFPKPVLGNSAKIESAASLAAMDSAVVVVLLAEWAIFTLLKHLSIRPDVFLGSSTGEFAALTMSGAVDIASIAALFYRLSTATANSISQEKLKNLRSLKIDVDFGAIEKIITSVNNDQANKVFLGASLSPTQSIVSGTRDAIDRLNSALDKEHIQYHVLPMAIPYHTPLVEGAIDPSSAEVQNFQINNFTQPAWACSTRSAIPANEKAIRQIVSELFTHPIFFKETIEAMHAEGITKFIEVGPKGSLTPLIAEILEGKSHVACATNTAVGSSLTQLHHLLATLFCQFVPMKFDYLFKRRSPKQLDLNNPRQYLRKKTAVRIQLGYPNITLSKAPALRQSQTGELESITFDSDNEVDELVEDSISPDTAIVQNYLSSLTSFHKQLMDVQKQVMSTYLQTQIEEDELVSPINSIANRLNELPMIRSAHILSFDDESVSLDLNLNLKEHQYLLDHAIGGEVSIHSAQPEKVYLMPLTVALETMAEAATTLMPNLKLIRVEHVRAYKRIRVSDPGLYIRITARLISDSRVSVSILDKTSLDRNEVNTSKLMSGEYVFADNYPHAPKTIDAPLSGARNPKISEKELYSKTTMFHGPRLQAVKRITSVNDNAITAQLISEKAANWFLHEDPPHFIMDPRLLDNVTQPVLFHLFENNHSVNALLPFLIESIELYSDLNLHGEMLDARATLSITSKGTEASIDLKSKDGSLLVRFNNISSRRISLPSAWHKFIYDPVSVYLGKDSSELIEEVPHKESMACFTTKDNDLPEDESVLLWCLDYVLSQRELDYFNNTLRDGKRRREWILGRLAAKDAVRALLKKNANIETCPADIEILATSSGQPIVSGNWQNQTGWMPVISITHKNGIAVALASHPSMASAVGIDVEEISDRDPNFYSLAFVKEETEQIQSRPPSEQALIATQIWCAKEALGKALGNGMQNDPKKISIQLDPTADQIPSSGLKIAHGTVRTPSLVGARTHDSTPEQIKIFYGQYADLAIAFTAL